MNITHTIKLVTSAVGAIQEIRKYQDQVVGAAKTVEKHTNVLSGDRIFKSANEWTAAVAKLGGATNGLATSEQLLAGVSQLTAAQKERLNRTISQAIEKYQAIGQQAPSALQAVYDATRKVNDEVTKQPTLLERAEAKAVALGTAAGAFLGNVAWSAVNKLGGEMQVFAQRGLQLGAVEASYERLATAAKQNSEEMLAALKSGSRGMVAEYDLMTAANKAMLLGLPVTTDSMGQLAQTATTLGRAMGLGPTKSLDDLITALGRSSPMILDNLGLTVKLSEAYDRYAEKLGLTASQLTEADKKTAFYEEAMRKAGERVAELGPQHDTLADIASRAWTRIGDTISSAVKTLNEVGGAALTAGRHGETAGNQIRDGFVNAKVAMGDTRTEAQKLQEVMREIERQVPEMLKGLTGLPKPAALSGPGAPGSSQSMAAAEAAQRAWEEAERKQKAAAEEGRRLAAAFQAQVDVLTGKALNRELAQLARQVQAAGQEGGLAAWQFDALGQRMSKLRQDGVPLPPVLKAIADEFDRAHIKALPLVSTLESVRSVFANMKGIKLGPAPWDDTIAGWSFSHVGAMDAALSPIVELERIADRMSGQAGTTAGATAGKAYTSAFSRALDGLGDIVIGALQGGGDVGRSVGASVGKGIGEDLAKSILGESTSKLLKGALSFLGPLGAVAGGALGGLIGGLFGKSAGRRELEEFNQKIKDMRGELLQTYGSYQNIAALDKALGTDVAAGWWHQGKAGFEAWTKSAEQLKAKLEAVKQEMADITANGGLLSADLQRFRDAMPEDADVQAFVLGQVRAAGTSVGAMLDAMQRASTAAAKAALTRQIDELKAGIASAVREGDDDLRDALERQLEELERQSDDVQGLVRVTATGASSMASILLASWDGTSEGLRQMAPALQQLQAAMHNSGVTGSAAFEQLGRMAGLASSAVTGPMLEAINHGTAALTAMHNSGFLTQETFAGMVDEIMAQRDALLASGATAADVNAAMQADLQRIWELVQDGRYAVDDKTRALLEEAEAAGQVGDRFRSTEDRMLAALERIATMFETVFARNLADAARRGAEEAERAMRGIPTDIDVSVRTHVRRSGGDGSGEEDGLPGYAAGTRGYEYFGAGTKVREKVTPLGAPETSGGVTIQINHPVVRERQDIDRIADEMIRRLRQRGLA